MKKKDIERVIFKIGSEGFDYCFDGYSNWGDINNEAFHKLRADYVQAKARLQGFLEEQAQEVCGVSYEDMLG